MAKDLHHSKSDHRPAVPDSQTATAEVVVVKVVVKVVVVDFSGPVVKLLVLEELL